MAHYAYINEKGFVIDVIVGKDENQLINGLEPEIYYALGTNLTVKRTSFHGNIRKNFAGIGYFYDQALDAFIPPKCHPNAILDSVSCQWVCQHDKDDTKTV